MDRPVMTNLAFVALTPPVMVAPCIMQVHQSGVKIEMRLDAYDGDGCVIRYLCNTLNMSRQDEITSRMDAPLRLCIGRG
jgi:hypothetical protein